MNGSGIARKKADGSALSCPDVFRPFFLCGVFILHVHIHTSVPLLSPIDTLRQNFSFALLQGGVSRYWPARRWRIGSICIPPSSLSAERTLARPKKSEGGESVCVCEICRVFSSFFFRLHRRVKSETRCVTNANRQKSSASLFHVNLFGCSSSSSYSTFYNPLRSITAGWDSGSFFFRCRHRRLQSESNKWGGKQRRRWAPFPVLFILYSIAIVWRDLFLFLPSLLLPHRNGFSTANSHHAAGPISHRSVSINFVWSVAANGVALRRRILCFPWLTHVAFDSTIFSSSSSPGWLYRVCIFFFFPLLRLLPTRFRLSIQSNTIASLSTPTPLNQRNISFYFISFFLQDVSWATILFFYVVGCLRNKQTKNV